LRASPGRIRKELFALFDEAYPQPKDGSLRAAPFAPYLAYEPLISRSCCTFGVVGWKRRAGCNSTPRGNAWIGNNWMPGAQSNVVNNIPGHVAKLAPDGAPLSPAISGFTGAGLEGLGWGGAVTLHDVWMPGLNGKILVMNFDGRPIASENDFPFHEKLGGLMGTGVAANADVWIADGSGDQLLFFPGGRAKEGRIVKAPGLKSPFDVVIDAQNRVWVSNSQSDASASPPLIRTACRHSGWAWARADWLSIPKTTCGCRASSRPTFPACRKSRKACRSWSSSGSSFRRWWVTLSQAA
jgi:hypothetical protein